MTREVHLLAFGNTRSAGPWRHPDIDNSTAGVRRRLIEHARTAEAGTLDALFFADEAHARQRLIEAEVAVTQGQLVIIAAHARAGLR